MTKRIHNFGAGPAALPLPVLERVRDEMVDFRGAGMSLLEMSHRGKVYEAVHAATIASLRRLLSIPESHAVIFMQGGGRGQFAIVPMNLLGSGFAQYLVTGSWAEIALEEAQKLGDARSLWSSAETKHDRVPKPTDYRPDPKAAYLHYTSNNTIYGTQMRHVAKTLGVPLVCDMSSDIASQEIDVAAHGLIYAGAQKNLGPAGVTVVIVDKALLPRSPKNLPEVFSYAEVAAKDSLLNTPPTFAIYMVGLVADYWLDQGGVAAVGAQNARKAQLLYDVIDGSGGFYEGHAQKDSRSLMNVTFRLRTPEHEKALLAEAKAAGIEGIAGHRSVGGLRASIYNAVPVASVEVLRDLLLDFQRKRG